MLFWRKIQVIRYGPPRWAVLEKSWLHKSEKRKDFLFEEIKMASSITNRKE
jgi:hypothetical protein